jgi:hypothetical protein
LLLPPATSVGYPFGDEWFSKAIHEAPMMSGRSQGVRRKRTKRANDEVHRTERGYREGTSSTIGLPPYPTLYSDFGWTQSRTANCLIIVAWHCLRPATATSPFGVQSCNGTIISLVWFKRDRMLFGFQTKKNEINHMTYGTHFSRACSVIFNTYGLEEIDTGQRLPA